MQLCLFCLSPLLCRWKGGHALWTPLCHSLADAGVFMCECAEGAKESEVAVQSADCTKTLLTSPAAASAAAAEVAASLVLARLMAEWAPPCPAVPLLLPQWRACWNWAGWHYRAQPDHTVKRDYAINRHAHKQHAAAEKKKKDPLPAWIKTGGGMGREKKQGRNIGEKREKGKVRVCNYHPFALLRKQHLLCYCRAVCLLCVFH